jgi:glycosyltransferase involved in cell wall biosynthesis
MPNQWVIVSDASTDRTDDIVSRYARQHDFIQLARVEGGGKRQFASKVFALRVGYAKLKSLEFDFIGNLDVDISLGPDYYENVLSKFHDNEKLGVAGGLILDVDCPQIFDKMANLNSVRGGVQLFRRQCYEEIGGYVPLELGGEDAVAETMVRAMGWEVRTFPEIRGFHLRVSGTHGRSIRVARTSAGLRDYLLGYHPLFFTLKAIRRMIEKPYVLGSVFMLLGYWSAYLTGINPRVSSDFLSHIRTEQVSQMRSVLKRAFRMASRGNGLMDG